MELFLIRILLDDNLTPTVPPRIVQFSKEEEEDCIFTTPARPGRSSISGEYWISPVDRIELFNIGNVQKETERTGESRDLKTLFSRMQALSNDL